MQIKNKKLTILIVLLIGAVISITYGVTAPVRPKGKLAAKEYDITHKIKKPREDTILTGRYMKRSDYKEWGRNPFAIDTEEEIAQTGLVLSGIFWDYRNPSAIVNDDIVTVGSVIDGSTVVAIERKKVVLDGAAGKIELLLNE